MRPLFLCVLLALAGSAAAADHVAYIDFFGYEGIDVAALRQALPVHAGDVFNEAAQRQIRQAVRRTARVEVTEVAGVCCDPHGATWVFVGLPGKTWREIKLNPMPDGRIRLAPELLAIMTKMEDARFDGVKKGGDAAAEDESQGYSLSHYPPAKELEMRLREYALAHEDEIYNALDSSADNYTRDQAAIAAGYTRQSPRQIQALLRATRDTDKNVRDESTRALGVLLASGSEVAKQIPAADFIEMMWSGTWMDRNKAAMVLDGLAASRDPKLLEEIHIGAWGPLMEMAAWRSPGHAAGGRSLMARVQGIKDERLPGLFDMPFDRFLAEIAVRK